MQDNPSLAQFWQHGCSPVQRVLRFRQLLQATKHTLSAFFLSLGWKVFKSSSRRLSLGIATLGAVG